jgi:predicted Ser/Thr protein kinase
MDVPVAIAGRFQIEYEIGRGGMGTVYRARHTSLNRTVAIKILNTEFAQNKETVERFMREARTMARLRDPGAVVIFDAGKLDDGRPFIVMEYVEGRTLADTLSKEGRFTPERAVGVAAEVCRVLQAAHTCGIVHRDLKPSNIMLRGTDVCVLDFGIAKVLAHDAEATRTYATTDSGILVGTPRYMSPEQCTGEKVGTASDLYSVGVLLYEMLVGRPPFTDALASAVIIKQATQLPVPLTALRPDVPRALAVAVHKLLAKNPAQRPRSAAEAASMLEGSMRCAAREANSIEIAPFAATMQALGEGSRFTFSRIAGLALISMMLSTLLFAWTRSDRVQSADRAAEGVSETPGNSGKGVAFTPVSYDAAFIAARRIARNHIVSDVKIVQTRRGAIIAALDGSVRQGNVNLFVMETRAGSYRLTKRIPLDTPDFRAASWDMQLKDVDADGFDEVLCAGRSSIKNRNAEMLEKRRERYVLFAPAKGEHYTLQTQATEDGIKRAVLSGNTFSTRSAPFREALKRRASANPPDATSLTIAKL